MQNNVAVISLKRIRENAQKVIRAAGGKPLIAVVKDDAYGHGASVVAGAIEPLCSMLAVATVDEGVYLRMSGIAKPILVLTPCLSGDEAYRAALNGLTVTIASLTDLHLAAKIAETYSVVIEAHFAVNTGMNRYGFRPERAAYAVKKAGEYGIAATGLYSHFYEPENDGARKRQTEYFRQALTSVLAEKEVVSHISATGGILAGENSFDAVRSGIALYGYLPPAFEGKLNVSPAMKLYTHAVRSGKAFGGGAGYATAQKQYGYLTTLRLGYGDGFFRGGIEGGVGKL